MVYFNFCSFYVEICGYSCRHTFIYLFKKYSLLENKMLFDVYQEVEILNTICLLSESTIEENYETK